MDSSKIFFFFFAAKSVKRISCDVLDLTRLMPMQASAYLLVTSASAAAEVLQLARRGDRDVSWGEVCSYFGRFCGKATVSLALHAAALACFVALSLVSGFRVFSKCHPPGGASSLADYSDDPKHAQEEQGK